MITVKTLDLLKNIEHIVKPTFFPDGTSQVWKLPEEIITSRNIKLIWNFDSEREIIDLLSLKRLLHPEAMVHLHIPFLPYARQDKKSNNNSTFNLHIIAVLINIMGCNLVTAVDVHNPELTERLINRFKNIEVKDLQQTLVSKIGYKYLVFPDYGAMGRYSYNLTTNCIIFHKVRDQSTGEITGLMPQEPPQIKTNDSFLIIDDICDGGATFIGIVNELKKINEHITIDLFVTHGIFSKGKDNLYHSGIRSIYTTNSLLKNREGYEV